MHSSSPRSALVALSGCATVTPKLSNAELQRQVADTERAFAKTMADRNLAAFASLLADDTVFFTSTRALRGKSAGDRLLEAVLRRSDAPFSWQPETSKCWTRATSRSRPAPCGTRQGKLVATFTSIWRLEAPGTWRIIFDKGNDVCDCPKP